MYTIIDNYLYDTENSEYIWGSSARKIFKTKNGRFFLVTQAYGAKDFEIISEEKVKNTLHDNLELYTKHFGKPLEA